MTNKTKVVSFRTGEKVYRRIKLISYAERRSVSNWIKKTVEMALDKEKI